MTTETVSTRDIGGLRRSRDEEGVDARIAELARRQHGVVARRQLLKLGLGEDAVERAGRGVVGISGDDELRDAALVGNPGRHEHRDRQ